MMDSMGKTHVARVVATVMAFMCLLLAIPRPVSAQRQDRQLVYAPLMLALGIAYQEWIAGPLAGHAPPAASFTAVLDGTKNPYRIAFALTKSLSTAEVSYAVSASRVIDSSSPQLPQLQGVSKGPIALSGSYVRAYLAAHAEHAQLEAAYGTSYASENSTGSAVVIATIQHLGHDAINVGFSQTAPPQSGPLRIIGCYKEQYYLVDPVTFAAKKTTIGCPS
jgi:hypothetical protein